MGAFFTSLHARADADQIIDGLKDAGALPAYVTASEDNWVSIYPKATEGQDLFLLERIAQALSTTAKATVYASLVHDSDVWDFVVLDQGRRLDHYCSQPGYFSGKKRRPSGGKADALLPICRAGTTARQLDDLLRRHLTASEPLSPELSERLAADMEKQKQWLAGSYEEMKASFAALGAPVPSLRAMLGRLDRSARKLTAGSGRADAADDLVVAFARMLGIPKGRAQFDYTYISRGEAPEGFAQLITA